MAAQACEERPTVGNGADPGSTLACLRLPQCLVPADAEAAAWRLGGRRFVVVWHTYDAGSGLAIWRRSRDGSWERLLERRRPTAVDHSTSLDDVTGDGRVDVLTSEASGSGACGARIAFRVEAGRAARLFRRHTCELDSELRDGLLWFREPIGDCPDARNPTHCSGGMRITIRGWSGAQLVFDRTIVRCLRRGLAPSRGCRRR